MYISINIYISEFHFLECKKAKMFVILSPQEIGYHHIILAVSYFFVLLKMEVVHQNNKRKEIPPSLKVVNQCLQRQPLFFSAPKKEMQIVTETMKKYDTLQMFDYIDFKSFETIPFIQANSWLNPKAL